MMSYICNKLIGQDKDVFAITKRSKKVWVSVSVNTVRLPKKL